MALDRRKILLLIGFLALVGAFALHAFADGQRSGELTLLTVAQGRDGEDRGGTAHVRLDIRPGNGAIFIDSFPLTRLDTQASTRYAQQIACDHLDMDCSRYDFFYTIRANSAVVGGPSASASIAVLTAAVLADLPIDESVAMTGTINSGGIVGPVSGVEVKVDGARAAGITTVLIPTLTTPDENETMTPAARNVTRPYPQGRVDELSTPDVEVIAVATLDDALARFTGKEPSVSTAVAQAPGEYVARMRSIADEICERNARLNEEIADRKIAYMDVNNYTARVAAVPIDDGYTRASLCFSQDLELRSLIVEDMTVAQRTALAQEVRTRIAEVRNATDATPIRTVGDLEIAAIVHERIADATDALDGVNASVRNDSRDLAYADERIRSAQSWSRLFGMDGAPLQVDDETLRRTCLAKIAEADERINYVRVYAPRYVDGAQEELDRAYDTADDPTLCILYAAKAAAEANLLLGTISVDRAGVDALLQEKLRAGERVIADRRSHGTFPILAYSYWRYAQSLQDAAPLSALTFAEEALELATLDMYFPKSASWRLRPDLAQPLLFFCYGVAFLSGIAILLWPRQPGGKSRMALEGPVRRRRRTGPSREKR